MSVLDCRAFTQSQPAVVKQKSHEIRDLRAGFMCPAGVWGAGHPSG
jgi:hypothetical protein